MTPQKTILIVDDQVEEILWLLELLQHRGYEVKVATNEKEANSRLMAIQNGTEDYAATIFDVMLSTLSIEDIVSSQTELNDDFYERSKDTGLRLCRKAKDLGLKLPMACLTVRMDAEVEAVSDETGIPVYHRIPLDESESIMQFIDQNLPALPGSKAKTPKAHRKTRRSEKQ